MAYDARRMRVWCSSLENYKNYRDLTPLFDNESCSSDALSQILDNFSNESLGDRHTTSQLMNFSASNLQGKNF